MNISKIRFERIIFSGIKATAILIFLITFSGRSRHPEFRAFRITGFAQGTNYHVTYYAARDVVTKDNINALFNEIDSSLSIYKPYSLINRFNNSVSGIMMDGHLDRVVKRSRQIYERSNGVFDITIYPIVDAWGFGNRQVGKLPGPEDITKLMACVGMNNLFTAGKTLQKKMPCVKIDVNGIAQGYSVDLLAELLESKGVENYLVEVGGEIRVKGRKQPENVLMKIGIEQPSGGTAPETLQKVLEIEEGAITTSGNYRKYIQNGNKKSSHLMNVKTGYPVDNELISVTVRARDAITADGYDNVLIGLGLTKAMGFLRKNKELQAYFIYVKDDGSIGDTASRGFFLNKEQRARIKD
ncbi:MAG: FAD:protein FMN transferase [Daejeonella sp.]